MKNEIKKKIDQLCAGENLTKEEFRILITGLENNIKDMDPLALFRQCRQVEAFWDSRAMAGGEDELSDVVYCFKKAGELRDAVYGKTVYLRGLIEFTNYCKNNCYYCGIRAGNANASRYRLTKEQILACAKQGYAFGFRTFVLQGGEDMFFTDERICDIVSALKTEHPDCAVTLSVGEKSRESYQAFFDAGADRYLLRHETANEAHYRKLHPEELSLQNRKRCLYNLKEIGFQVGCGMMLGSPYQTQDHLLEDLVFMQDLKPHMIGIGPFIPHKDTPFKEQPAGTLKQTLVYLSVLRLMFHRVLLPATTALGTIHPLGRELGILAGANVIMPNLSPADVRGKYLLYDGKICNGEEAAERWQSMAEKIRLAGCEPCVSRGDYRY